MKHTDLYTRYKELDAIERAELKKAVMAHGGEFRFENENGETVEGLCAPVVIACGKHWESPCDCVITRVAVNNGGYLEIYGHEKEWSTHEALLEVETGHVGYIIDNIPETDDVQDVSEKLYDTEEVPVISLCRNDIENAGYSPDITDEQLRQVAGKVQKYLEWQDFYSQFKNNVTEACEYWDIPTLNEEG